MTDNTIQPDDGVDQTDPITEDQSPALDADDNEQADTFSREYVEQLRQENAGHRTKLRGVQERLHRVLVEQTGQLADPADLQFDAGHLDDADALAAAIEQLLTARPHLRARRFDPGAAAQGPKADDGQVNLAELMRGML